jgi:hypothetical protein
LSHDIQHYDTQHNDTQHNEIQHNNTQNNQIKYNDVQYDDIQHNYTPHNNKNMASSITILSILIKLGHFVLTILNNSIKTLNAECIYSESYLC